MKVALVHDYLKEIGGAERVLMTLQEMFPEAPVYTAYKFPEFFGEFGEFGEIRESWGKYLPFLPKLISHYTILSPLFFRSFDLSDYDLVIVSQTGGYFPNGVRIGSKTKLVTYCHTPPRFLYGYETATRERNKWYWRPISAIANHILLMVDFAFAQKPHLFIANSKNIAERIKKFYRRESVVVYPPVSPPSIPPLNLSGGKYGEEIIRKLKNSNIEYLGEVTEEKKWELMAGAKAFLCLSRDEDFGISAVEAQMCGTPVIAFNGGGYRETVIHNKTGILFDGYNPKKLSDSISKFETINWNKKEIIKHAQKFSKENFIKQCRNYLK
ncbi:glycosyltransferase [Candidatus Amesbacteria bacterium]|nr:glycosyltransferase [Candidatus Amesbacteria bacterium]